MGASKVTSAQSQELTAASAKADAALLKAQLSWWSDVGKLLTADQRSALIAALQRRVMPALNAGGSGMGY